MTVQYVTNEQGRQVGVLLDIALYRQLTSEQTIDPDLLVGMTAAELEALADSKLMPGVQEKISDLLTAQQDDSLSEAQEAELDHLLAQIDQLTILKTRARYTLAHKKNLPTPTL
jgi:hypothetical protein